MRKSPQKKHYGLMRGKYDRYRTKVFSKPLAAVFLEEFLGRGQVDYSESLLNGSNGSRTPSLGRE